MARFLHYVALNFSSILEMAFTMDQMLFTPKSEDEDDNVLSRKHVFISGLARAGTTALMRLFYETGEFCSLTYRDMPFPLSPNLWRKCSGGSAREGGMNERAHGDGMMIDFDSPEALEEVFWRVFCGDLYLLPDRLIAMEARKNDIDKFRKYIAGLLQIYNSKRYLSKNNNNIVRLSSIRKAFPHAVIIIPFRDPVQHALSLYNQHRRFVEIHREDKFSKKYMKWLAHHEFGSDHRYFDLNSTASTKSLDDPEYWLEQWINVYGYILKQEQETYLAPCFVGYEELCDDPEMVWKALANCAMVGDELPAGFVLSKAPEHEKCDIESKILKQAYQIYSKLKDRFDVTVLGNNQS